MPAYDAKSIRQKNGEIVMDALKTINEPATFTDVVKHIADTQQVQIAHIKEPVKSVLQKGVEYGFIQKLGARYTADIDTGPEPATSTSSDRVRRYGRSRTVSRSRGLNKRNLRKRK